MPISKKSSGCTWNWPRRTLAGAGRPRPSRPVRRGCGREARARHRGTARSTRPALAQDLARDARQATRALARAPGFTIVALLSLALGIGANTAILTLMDAVLFRTVPVERPDRLYFLGHDPGPAAGPLLQLPNIRALPDSIGLQRCHRVPDAHVPRENGRWGGTRRRSIRERQLPRGRQRAYGTRSRVPVGSGSPPGRQPARSHQLRLLDDPFWRKRRRSRQGADHRRSFPDDRRCDRAGLSWSDCRRALADHAADVRNGPRCAESSSAPTTAGST